MQPSACTSARMARILTALVVLAAWADQQPRVEAVKWINSFAGPFIATLGPNWEKCPPGRSLNLIEVNLKISQFRNKAVEVQTQLQKMTGNVTVKIPITNDGFAYMRGSSRSQNQWKENAYFFKFPEGPCIALLEYYPDFSRKLYGLDEKDRNKNCTVPTGLYTLNEVPMNWTIPKITVFPYGTYRFEVGFDLGTVAKPRNIMCFITEITTHPKL